MRKILLLTLLLIFGILNSFSQSEIIFDRTETQSFLIRYGQGENTYKNQIFTKLANSYNKPRNAVSFTFSYKLSRQVLRTGNQLEFIVNMSDIRLSGDNLYREFDISNALVPSKMSFKMQWLNGRNIINTYTFNDVSISDSYISLVNMTVTEAEQSVNISINLIDKVFKYSYDNMQLFNNTVDLVDNYYDENIVARNKIRKLNGMNISEDYLSHLQDLNQLFTLRDEANTYIEYTVNVKQKNFYKNLPIDTYDPSGIKNKLIAIEDKAETLRDICNDIIDNFDRIYYERGIEMLSQRKPDRADYFFNKSLEINPNFAPSHYQLARLYYNSGYVDKAVDKVFEIRSMNPDTETKLQTVELAKGIYSDFLLDAGELNNDRRYNDAIAILNRAAEICREFPEVHCRQNMDIEFSRAINGKYQAILNEIDVNLRNNNYKEAERIIGVALDFAQNNRTFISDNSAVADKISNLYFKYVENGNKYNYQSKFSKAINEFDNAARVCNGYREINCTNELEKGYFRARTGMYNSFIKQAENVFRSGNNSEAERYIDKAISFRKKYNLKQNAKEDRLFLDIKQSVYATLIDDGRKFSNAGNYKTALNKFDEADNLEKSFGLRSNPKLRTYITDAAKKMVLQTVDAGKNKVRVNNLTKARKLYNKAKSLVAKYNLGNNTIVKRELSDLKGQIFAQECINAQQAYDVYANEVQNLISAKKYIEADNKINQAFSHSDSYAQCEIDTRELRDKKDYISVAVNYLKKIIAVNDYLKRRNYKSAIENYIAAENYHKVQVISKYGIAHKPLFEFIQASYTDFIIYSVGFYNHNKEYNKALDLLRELSRRKVKSKYTKDMQTILGTDMATNDFGENSRGNLNSNIASYIAGDKFFKYFKKAYKKQWKRLD
ncbi:MAG: tetratricopeptide repeat protein [Bacteroidales bacterium]|nr:tetratricopeptide repeat protein [Bacteroidales bacterium]